MTRRSLTSSETKRKTNYLKQTPTKDNRGTENPRQKLNVRYPGVRSRHFHYSAEQVSLLCLRVSGYNIQPVSVFEKITIYSEHKSALYRRKHVTKTRPFTQVLIAYYVLCCSRYQGSCYKQEQPRVYSLSQQLVGSHRYTS